MNLRVEQQCHGYKNGHQMLAASSRLSRGDQDVVDRLSDISGPLRPGETFAPYLSAYPLPSKQYYVIAKTWQDLKAPRAGCVLTRSLLINLSNWSTLDYPSSLMGLLYPIDRFTPSADSIDFATKSVPMEPVKISRVVSLVEALFLEDRSPIVMFDEPESELISQRLLSALWPAFRQSFSLCTLSLSPRSIEGKSFDLMFAPKDAKSRFAQWQGRVFEPQSSFTRIDAPRHSWSSPTTEHIFIDDPPSLVSLDALGVLGADAASLRLALLWNELLVKAKTSPTAILGLLDILRSRGKSSSEEVLPFSPVLLGGIELAKATLGASEMLRFALTLAGKFPSNRPPIDVLRKIRDVLTFSASQHPQAILDLYQDRALGKELRAPLVTAGLGDGLARSLSGLDFLSLASKFSPEDQLRFLAFSNEWARSLLSLTAANSPSEWSAWLTNALRYPDANLKRKVRKKVVPYLRHSLQAPLLEALLEDVDGATVLSVAEQIRIDSDFQIASFDQPLCEAAERTCVSSELRREILKASKEESANRFLSASMSFTPNDIEWAFANAALTRRRVATLILTAFRGTSNESVRKFLEDEKLSVLLEELFLNELPSASMDLARLLLLGNIPVSMLLNDGIRIMNNLDPVTQDNLSLLMLERGLLSGTSRDDATLKALLSQSTAFSDPRSIVSMMFSEVMSNDRVAKNLVMLNHAEESVRLGALNEVEVLTDRLTRKDSVDFSDETVHSWSSLILDSGSVNPYGQARAAVKALSFALEHPSKPLSELVVISFPLVYEQLRTGQEPPGPLSFLFTDWDHCKTARKGVTHAFLHSDWPAVDFLRAVAPTGDLEKVFRTLSREKGGDAFLSKLYAAISALSGVERLKIEDFLSGITGPAVSDASFDQD